MKVKHILSSILIFWVRIECALRFFFLFVLLREFFFSENTLSGTEWWLLLFLFVPASVVVSALVFIDTTYFFLAVLCSSFFVAPYLIGFSIYEFAMKKESVCVNSNRRRITDLLAYWIILAGCIFLNGFFYLGRPLGEWCLLFLSSLVGAIFFAFGWEHLSSGARQILSKVKILTMEGENED